MTAYCKHCGVDIGEGEKNYCPSCGGNLKAKKQDYSTLALWNSIAAVILLVAILPLPYGFYMFLRVVVFVSLEDPARI